MVRKVSKLSCDRGKHFVEATRDLDVTMGGYDVSGEPWSHFANEHEQFICDPCMFADPRYQAVYGVHQ